LQDGPGVLTLKVFIPYRINKWPKLHFCFFSLLSFFVFLVPADAQQTVLKLDSRDKQIQVSMFLVEYSPADIFSRLEEGLRSEVGFSIHVYRETRGILRLFTQRLVHEETFIQEARWDVFQQQYVIEKESGEILKFSRKEDFISEFFSLKNYTLRFSPENGKKYYTLGRINVETIIFLPPLNILSSIIPANIVTTAWEREEIIE
jgi:hypothetical protein